MPANSGLEGEEEGEGGEYDPNAAFTCDLPSADIIADYPAWRALHRAGTTGQRERRRNASGAYRLAGTDSRGRIKPAPAGS
jgi:hypothetical protein